MIEFPKPPQTAPRDGTVILLEKVWRPVPYAERERRYIRWCKANTPPKLARRKAALLAKIKRLRRMGKAAARRAGIDHKTPDWQAARHTAVGKYLSALSALTDHNAFTCGDVPGRRSAS